VKVLAFVIGLLMMMVGVIGIVTPSVMVSVAQNFGSPPEWYAIGIVRIALGVLLFFVAKTSRAPRMLRVLAVVPILAGLGALAAPFMDFERARETLEWWSRLAPGYIRLTALAVLAFGGFIAYVCGPDRRPA
jgi:hypothetical protein